MQMRTQAMASKIWSLLRLGIVMMRKGLISKRKLIVDVNLLMKKGRLLGKSIGKGFAIAFSSAHHRRHSFPEPAFQHCAPQQQKQKQQQFCGFDRGHHHQHLPCLSSTVLVDDNSDASPPPILPTTTTTAPVLCQFTTPRWEEGSPPSSSYDDDDILASPDRPLSVRVSDYSSDEDEVVSRPHVDDEAEEFIRRFHLQLRVQRLLCQEMERHA